MKNKGKNMKFRDIIKSQFVTCGIKDYIGWMMKRSGVCRSTISNYIRHADHDIGKNTACRLTPTWAAWFIWASRQAIHDGDSAIPNEVERYLTEALIKWETQINQRKRK